MLRYIDAYITPRHCLRAAITLRYAAARARYALRALARDDADAIADDAARRYA